MKFYLKNIKKIKIKNFQNQKGLISVISKNEIPKINFKRIFFVSCNKSTTRGNHAHKKCYQFMFSLMGKIKLIFDDGLKKKEIIIEPKKNGFLVPPTIWSSQKYLNKNSMLGVICDRNFEAKDYIRNYKEFKKIYNL